jgi:regulator of protease activity HflC (stomatin/prohibitin superfamily)
MFDKLIEFLLNFWNDLMPITYINEWEQAVYLRFGKFVKIVGPGLVWKIPFVDKLWATPVITQTVHLQPQTLTTLDEHNIVLKSIVRYHVSDSKKFLLNVMHASDVLVDTTQGIIRDTVEKTNWYDLENVNDTLTIEASKAVSDWGIEIERVTLTDLGIINTYRIMTDSTKPVVHINTQTHE